MRPKNGLESGSLVSFGIASGPDRAVQGGNLSKHEGASWEMVVWAVCSEQVSVSIPSLSGKIQGISKFLLPKQRIFSQKSAVILCIHYKFPAHGNREF